MWPSRVTSSLAWSTPAARAAVRVALQVGSSSATGWPTTSAGGRSTSRPAAGLASSTRPSGSSTRTGSLIVRKIWLRATGRRSSRLNW
jgi:hypothetical protein